MTLPDKYPSSMDFRISASCRLLLIDLHAVELANPPSDACIRADKMEPFVSYGMEGVSACEDFGEHVLGRIKTSKVLPAPQAVKCYKW